MATIRDTIREMDDARQVLDSKCGTRVKIQRAWNEEPLDGELSYDTCYGCYRVSDVTFTASNVRAFKGDVIVLE